MKTGGLDIDHENFYCRYGADDIIMCILDCENYVCQKKLMSMNLESLLLVFSVTGEFFNLNTS